MRAIVAFFFCLCPPSVLITAHEPLISPVYLIPSTLFSSALPANPGIIHRFLTFEIVDFHFLSTLPLPRMIGLLQLF